MTGDQQDDTIAALNRLVQASVDGRPRLVKIVPMQVDHPVGFYRTAVQPPIPASVEGRSGSWPDRLHDLAPNLGLGSNGPFLFTLWPSLFLGFRLVIQVTRKRPNARRYARPECLFVRAERTHGRPRLWAGGSAPTPARPCRRRWPLHRRPRPKKYRTGWRL